VWGNHGEYDKKAIENREIHMKRIVKENITSVEDYRHNFSEGNCSIQ
jgi:hypothetical protein